MYKIGEYIMYGKSGVCELTDICVSPFDGKDDKTYYVLRPLFGTATVIYTPVENPKVASRPLMKKSAASNLIRKMPEICELEIENERLRRDIYKQATASLLPEGFVSVIKTVYTRRRAFASSKRHIAEVDAEYETYAKRALYSELSVVLGIPFEEIEKYVLDRINEEKASGAD